MTTVDSLMQEADALEALEAKSKQHVRYHQDCSCQGCEAVRQLLSRAMPLIRALRERVDYLDACARGEHDDYVRAVQLNESLEAERDIWRERAQGMWTGSTPVLYDETHSPLPDPTPEEIAARIQQKKTEAKP